MRILPSGDAALLVELPGLPEMLGLYAALAASPPPGVADLVPAARTLTLLLDPSADPAAVAAAVRATRPGTADGGAGEAEIPVVYDGDDLAEVARLTGLAPDEVVAAHTGTPWRVAFTGFAPGFGYLEGGDPRLDVPRRATPRVRVPAGAVGLAGRFSGVYPVESPGGWRLIGRTEAVLWDLERDPPALLRPGTRVRFVRREL
ncbi:5-oxoprolinase subunit B family protein [Actinomadura citrea]|uniref:5-oxoprolinase subunit B family protein n=1 Tax=Actinomadura TaxID=1988 RepID=UPI0033C51C76